MSVKPSSQTPHYHHGNLRNTALQTAEIWLEASGLPDLSLRALAREIGVSDTAIRHHFESREALLASLASRGFLELLSRRRRAAESKASARDMAQEMMLLYVEFARQHKGMFNLMVGPRILDRGAYPELLETSKQSFAIFRNALNRYALECGWPASELNYVEHAAWATEHGLADLIIGDRVPRSGETLDVDKMVQFTVRLLLDGIAACRSQVKPHTSASASALVPALNSKASARSGRR